MFEEIKKPGVVGGTPGIAESGLEEVSKSFSPEWQCPPDTNLSMSRRQRISFVRAE
jgi:hypothetical protein